MKTIIAATRQVLNSQKLSKTLKNSQKLSN
jgi:hypothetical protein